MANDVTAADVNTTASDLVADDKHCCFSEFYHAFETFLLSDPHFLIWKFISPVIIVLGTFGNVMTIVIMKRMSEGQSSHTMSLYFTALAVSDLVILYSWMLSCWLRYYFNLDVEFFNIIICRLLPFLVYCSGVVSAWLIVAMTMQRVMSVVWPHLKNLSCTKTKVGLVIATVVVVSIALNAHRIISYESAGQQCCNENKGVYYYDNFIYPWIDLLLSSIIPFIILIFGNSVLIRNVIRSLQVARMMTSRYCDQVNNRQKKVSSLTFTLITVSLVFLFLSLPSCICLIVASYVNTMATSLLVFTTSFLVWYTSSVINFYLYCLTGHRFRSELKSLFCGQLKKSTVICQTKNTVQFSNMRSTNNHPC